MNNQISSEQHPHIDNQQNENSTQNNTKKSEEVVNGIKKIKKTPMNPTPLYVWLFSFSIHHLNILLENIHGGHNIQLKHWWEHLFYSQF
jgi:hypothetical protein